MHGDALKAKGFWFANSRMLLHEKCALELFLFESILCIRYLSVTLLGFRKKKSVSNFRHDFHETVRCHLQVMFWKWQYQSRYCSQLFYMTSQSRIFKTVQQRRVVAWCMFCFFSVMYPGVCRFYVRICVGVTLKVIASH
jgi:hypothetical protein